MKPDTPITFPSVVSAYLPLNTVYSIQLSDFKCFPSSSQKTGKY